MKKEDIKEFIDHTLLKPEATLEEVKALCSEAKKNGFAAVCINPCFVSHARNELEGSKVKVCTVIGFPLGASTSKVKALETRDAIENGADEVDMVINIGRLKEGDIDYVRSDINSVVFEARNKAVVKVIIETSLLTDTEKEIACKLAKEVGADFVKTSTGFSGGGATLDDVKLMKKAVEGSLKVKASGGIRSYEDAINMISAGADRLGTSSSLKIIGINNEEK
ncbi:deoxyribose-phosphate aldolase [Clostridium cylindrosporum]|uniref:Deoxyribose-phosphate aldolase n=1 Tax=Clostridium cylindrosporum DSM 605 TaxID=1121307 RepID=A0A0J8D6B2_CLOCY|nr:deoxyribose-phosphate aldolase [Clostridium cylindrosporum]KMT21392.1 deoxyribose-phosphate aldolase DeoC [Clostridium cylindrosporum DSM 605]